MAITKIKPHELCFITCDNIDEIVVGKGGWKIIPDPERYFIQYDTEKDVFYKMELDRIKGGPSNYFHQIIIPAPEIERHIRILNDLGRACNLVAIFTDEDGNSQGIGLRSIREGKELFSDNLKMTDIQIDKFIFSCNSADNAFPVDISNILAFPSAHKV